MSIISIIIPVYNVEKYLRQCLDSVISQTFTDFECICVNDGSTDSSLSILQEYVNKDKRFKIIDKKMKAFQLLVIPVLKMLLGNI
jgi:glycosyltransferase involved in cell wall biosynthesis